MAVPAVSGIFRAVLQPAKAGLNSRRAGMGGRYLSA
jgi:hypothetical protein